MFAREQQRFVFTYYFCKDDEQWRMQRPTLPMLLRAMAPPALRKRKPSHSQRSYHKTTTFLAIRRRCDNGGPAGTCSCPGS